jgi:hypothetical protein
VIRKLFVIAGLSLLASWPAAAAPDQTLPRSVRACISIATAPLEGTILTPEGRIARHLVLCVMRSKPAPYAARALATYACMEEFRFMNFAVKYGGGTYTTLRDCVTYKTGRAVTSLSRAQRTGAKACSAKLRAGAPVWHDAYSKFGFGIYLIDGRC